MDIGREVRRYRAEPIESPVPGAAPAPAEHVTRTEVEPVSTPSTTREVAAEASV